MEANKSTQKESFKTKFIRFYKCEVKLFNKILGVK